MIFMETDIADCASSGDNQMVFFKFVIRFLLVLGLMVSAPTSPAGPETDYVAIYKKITSATQYMRQGRNDIARQNFNESLQEILNFQQNNRSWNPGIINFRISYIREKLAELGDAPNTSNLFSDSTTPIPQDTRVNSPTTPQMEQQQQQLTDQLAADQQILNHLKSRVESLESEKEKLSSKLREALTAGPNQVAPEELEATVQKMRELTIENQLLQVQLAESVKKAADIAPADEIEKKVKDLSDQVTVLTLEKQGLTLELERMRSPARSDGQALIPNANPDENLIQMQIVLSDLEMQLQSAKSELLAKTRSEEQIQNQIAQITRSNQSLAAENKSQAQQIRDLQAQLSGLDNLNHYKNHIAALEGDLASKEVDIRRLTEENQKLTQSNALLQDELRQLSGRNQELQHLIQTKDQQILDSQNELEDATSRFQNQLAQLQLENQSLQTSLKNGSQTLNQSQDRLESNYAMIQREMDQLKHVNDRLKDENLELRQRLNKANAGAATAPIPSVAEASPASKDTVAPVSTTPRLAAYPEEIAPMADVKPQNLSSYASEETAIEMLPYNESEFSRMLRIEKELTSVLNANPRDLEARNRFAALLMDRGEFQKARMFVNETIRLFPEESEPMVIKALLERQEKNFDQAVKVLTEAIELNPENPNAHMLLGTVLSELGQRKPAEESLRRAVRLDPVNPLAHFNLSVAYLYQNPPYRALAQYHYNEAVRLGHPRDSEIEIRIQRTR